MKGFTDVRKVIEPINAQVDESQAVADAPAVINANDAGPQAVTYGVLKNGYIIQNAGPKSAKIRINGDAGLGDGEYNFEMSAHSVVAKTGIALAKISAICDAGLTAKLIITSEEKTIYPVE